MTVDQMLKTHPGRDGAPDGALVTTIEALLECATTCNICADACLEEPMVKDLRGCIRLNAECADVCTATARALARVASTRSSEVVQALLEACAMACRACGAECEAHAAMGMEHCRTCAEACKRCEQACRQLVATF